MADYLFVPQTVLDKWSEQGRVRVEGKVLTLLDATKKKFQLTSAVRFVKLEAGEDKAKLLHKVKTTDALKQMGAEVVMHSVLLGETAYQVQQGFLADANALRRAVSAAQEAKRQSKEAAGTKKDASAEEPDLLAQFLLENLS
jgi:hypothetical protein